MMASTANTFQYCQLMYDGLTRCLPLATTERFGFYSNKSPWPFNVLTICSCTISFVKTYGHFSFVF